MTVNEILKSIVLAYRNHFYSPQYHPMLKTFKLCPSKIQAIVKDLKFELENCEKISDTNNCNS